jgi:hypothetical protein
LTRLELGRWVIDVDIIETQKFYERYIYTYEVCSCLYCKNYFHACKSFPRDIRDFFNSLGLQPEKGSEVYKINKNDDRTYLYGGFYHIVGRLISTNDPGFNAPKSSLDVVDLTSDFKFGFTTDLALVPEGFPQPVLQLEIYINVPWVLDEEP